MCSGDELTMPEVAAALSTHLGREIQYRYDAGHWPGDTFFEREMRVMFEWYNRAGYQADLVDLRGRFPGLLDFSAWLAHTGWPYAGLVSPSVS